MRTRIVRQGNDAAIRIPAPIMRAAQLETGQEVDIRAVDGGIVIGSVQHQRYNLAELVEGITPDNRHDQIDFGDAVGRGAW